MKDLTVTLTIILAAAALAGCAGAPQQASEQSVPVTTAVNEAKDSKKHPDCITETGTRLPRSDGKCNGLAGIVVTREDLERSGSIRTLDQLRRLP